MTLIPERLRMPLLMTAIYGGSALVSMLIFYGVYALFGFFGIILLLMLLVLGYGWLINTAVDDIIEDMRERRNDKGT